MEPCKSFRATVAETGGPCALEQGRSGMHPRPARTARSMSRPIRRLARFQGVCEGCDCPLGRMTWRRAALLAESDAIVKRLARVGRSPARIVTSVAP